MPREEIFARFNFVCVLRAFVYIYYMHAEYTISGRRTRVCLRAAASRCACSCLASFSFTIAAPGCPLRLNLDVERARRKVRQRVLALGSAGQKR